MPRLYSRITQLAALFFAAWLGFRAGAGIPEKEKQGGRLQFESPPALPFSNGELILQGSDVRRQILVTEIVPGGESRDVTHRVSYSVEPPDILQVTNGMVVPLQNGKANLLARSKAGFEARLRVVVQGFENTHPIHFAN